MDDPLCDSIEKHMRQKRIFWCQFKPKITKISQEMADLGQFTPERLCDSIGKHIEQRDPNSNGVDLYQNDYKSVKTWLSYGRFLPE